MIANFLDIDYTIWDNDAKWWIIDKNNPNKYIIRISKTEAELIKSGFYKNEELPIYYNGIEGYLSNDIFNKLHKYKKISLQDIGISNREYFSDKLIKKQINNFVTHIDKFDILKDKENYLITQRGNKKGHEKLLNKLKEKINIENEYFLSDNKTHNFTGSIIEKKMLTFLMHLIGYEISNNKFEPLLVKKYKKINYYTDLVDIVELTFINDLLINIYNNSPEFIKSKIKSYLELNDVYLIINVVTSNEYNPFVKKEIKIELRDF